MPDRRRSSFPRDALVSLAVASAAWAGCEASLRALQPQLPRTEAAGGVARASEDSVLGHRYVPGARAVHRTPEFTAEYAIDADGRRAGAQWRDSLGVRVLVLGDSFTFGAGVAADEVWTMVMARALAARGLRADVVNAGVEGYDTRSQAHLLFELAPALRPDVVLLAFLANDVYTNRPLVAAPWRSSDERGGALSLHSAAWAKRLLVQSDRLYALTFLMTARREYYAVPPGDRVVRQLAVTRELIGAMETYCRERSIAFAVVSIPQLFGVLADARGYDFGGVDASAIDRDLGDLARERGITWIEMLPRLARAYRESGTDLYYRVDGHLTPEGNRVLGQAAADALAPTLVR